MTNAQLKLKIHKDHPYTLQDAIGLAINEQNLRARANMSHTKPTHESMEVEHSQGERFRIRNTLNRVNSTAKNRSSCWNCAQESHIIRDCRIKEQGSRPAMGHGKSRKNEARPLGFQES